MMMNLTLSFVICFSLITLMYIIIINSVFLEKIYIKTRKPVTGVDDADDSVTEGLTNREYYSLLNSIQKIDDVDPSSVFLTTDTISVFDKTKGNSYYNSPINFLGSYDNTNIIKYIDGLVNINNTTDKNFNKLSIASKNKDDVYSKYSCFTNMKQFLKKNTPIVSDANMTDDIKMMDAELTSKRPNNGSIEKNLKIVIKNNLLDVVSVLYTDYSNYITTLNGKIYDEKKKT